MKRKRVLAAVIAGVALAAASGSAVFANGWGFGMGSNATPDEIAQQQTDMFQYKADVLGVKVDEVKDAWAKGQTLEELANAKGITDEQLQDKMQASRKTKMQAQLKTLVDKGVITQAQADQRLKVMEDRIASGEGPGKGMRGMGMHRGMEL
ncbi:MAG: hypothetical protein Q8O51_00165 [bacterium]|nr:hypothetical protein [bacterium]